MFQAWSPRQVLQSPPLPISPLLQTLKILPRIWDLDGPNRANRFADSRESPDSRESFQGSRTEPFFCESRFGGGGLKIANRRFEAIRANRWHAMKIGFFVSANRFARIALIRNLRIAGPSKIWEHQKSQSQRVDLFYLRLGRFLLTVGLGCLRLVLVAYGWIWFGLFTYGCNLVWSSLLMVEIEFGLFYLRFPLSGNWVWSSLLTVPPP